MHNTLRIICFLLTLTSFLNGFNAKSININETSVIEINSINRTLSNAENNVNTKNNVSYTNNVNNITRGPVKASKKSISSSIGHGISKVMTNLANYFSGSAIVRCNDTKFNESDPFEPLTQFFGMAKSDLKQLLRALEANHGRLPIPKWSYENQTHWPEFYPECNGTRQSPIDIPKYTKSSVGEPIRFLSWKVVRQPFQAKNDGRSLVFIPTARQKPQMIFNGVIFRLAQIHLHWGKNNQEGSEHTIDKRRYPLEMHFVFFNEKYAKFNVAKKRSDGLAIVAQLFEIKDFNQFDIDGSGNMIKTLSRYRTSEAVRMNLANIVPPLLSQYFLYQGSLTTPPCTQNVQWIITTFTKPVSRPELESLRHLESKNGFINSNWRQLQSNDNPVKFIRSV